MLFSQIKVSGAYFLSNYPIVIFVNCYTNYQLYTNYLILIINQCSPYKLNLFIDIFGNFLSSAEINTEIFSNFSLFKFNPEAEDDIRF